MTIYNSEYFIEKFQTSLDKALKEEITLIEINDLERAFNVLVSSHHMKRNGTIPALEHVSKIVKGIAIPNSWELEMVLSNILFEIDRLIK